MTAAPDPPLEIRTSGCLAALAIGVIVVGGSAGLFSLLTGRPLRLGAEWGVFLMQMVLAAAPFAVLAGARTRAPWLTGLALTLALWGYVLFDGVRYQWHPDGSGANIGLGQFMIVSPFLIIGANVGILLWQRLGERANEVS